jgi:hypothetical protein
MRIRSEHRYPADIDRVFLVLGQEAFHEQVCRSTGAVDFQVRIHQERATQADVPEIVIQIERTMPTDRVPDFVRSFVGTRLRISETYRWWPSEGEGTRPGEVTVQVHGAPVRLVATLRLSAETSGCLYTVDGELTASIPFLGSRVTKAAEPAVRAAIDAQHTVAESWLRE